MQTILRILKQAGGWHHGCISRSKTRLVWLWSSRRPTSQAMRTSRNLCVSLRRTEWRLDARPRDVFRAWIHRRATPERFLLPQRLCRRGAVEPHDSRRQLCLPRQLAPAARAIRQGLGQQSAIAGLRRSLRAATADPTRLNLPAPERMGKRVRSTTPNAVQPLKESSHARFFSLPNSRRRHHPRIHH